MASFEDRCLYSFDLVVSETDDDTANRFTVRLAEFPRLLPEVSIPPLTLQTVVTLHPTLAPLIVLGHIRQGTVFEVGRVISTRAMQVASEM